MHPYTTSERNAAICRKDLDLIGNGNFLASGYEECQDMTFIRVKGYTRFWEAEEKQDCSGFMADILCSFVRHGISFAFVIRGSARGIEVYIGTMRLLLDGLMSSIRAVFSGADLDIVPDNPLRSSTCAVGGMFVGLPTNKISEKKGLQIENICQGMLGKDFTYAVLATGISGLAATFGHERLLEEMSQAHALISQTITGGAQGNLSVEHQDFQSKNYFENLELLEKTVRVGAARGMWRVNGYYGAANPVDARCLSNIIKASYSGDDSRPENFRTIEYNSIRDVISNTYMIADPILDQDLHPLGRWQQPGINQDIVLYVYRFQTVLNSEQLAVLCQLPTKEFPGFYLNQYVEFDVSTRNLEGLMEPVPLGRISADGGFRQQNVDNSYFIEKNDLTRHALIIGITGGGKTNTTKSILSTLWAAPPPDHRVPFLVIESAKREYWELRNIRGFEDLLVFTLGAEAKGTSVRYRINPFETVPGISLQTHIDYLLSTFKAAFELYAPMPYVLESAVYQVYQDRGWDIVENSNRYGLTQYPTLSDLYHKIDVVVEQLGYHQEVQSNVKAALQARIGSLMIGGKGAMLNTPKSLPIQHLLSMPVVMELEDLGDDETKSFVIGILLVQLYEYRKSLMGAGSKKLSHILMVEEAHRLLKNVPEGGEGGNTRAKSVEFFCNLLAEIRTFGQGIIIADQIPTKLAPDTIKNTNLKIVHRTVAQEDRDTIGHAMNMTDNQIEYLSSLQRGVAAVYAEGDNRPKCVRFPLVEAQYDKKRQVVINEVNDRLRQVAEGYDTVARHHAGCSYCEHVCSYRDTVLGYLGSRVDCKKVAEKWSARKYAPSALSGFLSSTIMKELLCQNPFQELCVLGTVLEESELAPGFRIQALADYLRHVYA